MSWHGETNPHFWPRDPPQPSGDQPGPSRPQPGRKPKPREQPGHVHLPPTAEPVPSGPIIHPHEDRPGRKTKPDHIRLPPTTEPIPTRPRIHEPEDHPGRQSKPDHIVVPPTAEPIASGPRIHPPEERRPWWKSKPDHTVLPSTAEPIASGSRIHPPEERRPWWKSKPKEQPSRIGSGPRIHAPENRPRRKQKQKDHARPQPEYELTPAGHDPEFFIPPTSKDHWPMHQHEASEDHWPLRPHQASQDGPPIQPHPLPRTHDHQPHVGLAPAGHPPPHRQPGHWPLDPHTPSQYEPPTQPHPHPKKHDHQPHIEPAPGTRPPPHRQPPAQPDPHPKKHHQPHIVGPTPGRHPPRRHQGPPHVGPTEEGGHPHPRRDQNLIYPSPNRTNPCTWFIAVFCVILWVVIILGGILILIIYLLYRPRSPHFEISDASLNAAYLDMGYLLNADLTLLVNFTNPNHKMSIDFNFIVLKLRYENHLIANQYIEPFTAGKLEHKFARVEMVGSQIRLPVLVTQQLVKQIQGNKITFELDGYFHARSRLGGIFRYSYWMYTHCTIITRGPPTGVGVFAKCITKR